MKKETCPPEEDDRATRCLSCGCQHFYVVYTRRTVGGKLLRRRECRHCGRRVTTAELIDG